MQIKHLSVAGAAVILVVVFFFVGRITAPHQQKDVTKLIDSLKRDREIAIRLASQHQEMETLYRNKAEQNLRRAIEAEKVKVVHHTIYRNDTTRNRSLTVLQRDSVLLSIFYP